MRYMLCLLVLVAGSLHAETYNECILENMKGVGSQYGAALVNKACREKALPQAPAKCVRLRTLADVDPWNTSNRNPAYLSCINSCLNASEWSKHFGECAP